MDRFAPGQPPTCFGKGRFHPGMLGSGPASQRGLLLFTCGFRVARILVSRRKAQEESKRLIEEKTSLRKKLPGVLGSQPFQATPRFFASCPSDPDTSIRATLDIQADTTSPINMEKLTSNSVDDGDRAAWAPLPCRTTGTLESTQFFSASGCYIR